LLDGEPWKRVKVFDPNEHKILDITGKRSLRKQGLTELFFESSEPSLDEVSLDEFLARFPEGEYEFKGWTINGVELESEAILTHVIPAGPEIISPLSLTEEPLQVQKILKLSVTRLSSSKRNLFACSA
jgi:hypothetical protein